MNISNVVNLLCFSMDHKLSVVVYICEQVDENTAKANQVKQSGQAKVKQLADKYEEIVKQVFFFLISILVTCLSFCTSLE